MQIQDARLATLRGETLLARRIKAGMAVLDQKFGRGSWEGNIHFSTLDLACKYGCVIGQIFGNYNDQLGFPAGILVGLNPVELGFMEDELIRFPILTRGWKNAIQKRQREHYAAHDERQTELGLVA